MKNLYDIYLTNEKNDAPDLTIGLAMYKAEHPGEITHEGDAAIRQFIGRHGAVLAQAFKAHDRAMFEAVVDECIKKDAED